MTSLWISGGPKMSFSFFLFGFIILDTILICILIILIIFIRNNTSKIPSSITFSNLIHPFSYHIVIIFILLWMLIECLIWIREISIYLYRLRLMYYYHNKYNGSIHQQYIAYELNEYFYEDLTCKFCKHKFNKKMNQILLICGHRFCHACLGLHEAFVQETYSPISTNLNNKNRKRCPICQCIYNINLHKWDYKYHRNKNMLTTMACHKQLFVRLIHIEYQ
eukprot:115700_1